MRFEHGITIVVERPSGTTEHGEPLPPTTHTVDDCGFAPGSSNEFLDARDTTETLARVFAPYGADVQTIDVVVLPDGTRWHVAGEPAPWRSPFTGWEPGLEVSLTRWRG